jgi:hypothetical protein
LLKETDMQHVLYPGHAGQPSAGEYAIALDHSDTFPRADIVLVSRLVPGGASFYTAGFGRDAVVNRILANELKGIRLEWIRLFLLVEKTANLTACQTSSASRSPGSNSTPMTSSQRATGVRSDAATSCRDWSRGFRGKSATGAAMSSADAQTSPLRAKTLATWAKTKSTISACGSAFRPENRASRSAATTHQQDRPQRKHALKLGLSLSFNPSRSHHCFV